ncbi:MAG TPA: DmsC/YnfH family molybdoenzyme membrane anchor subunit [Polyangiaceae bacterium]|nr:DmsC/YnfH family molybdoenzyme membrane anchor subunit [Polyangiaceae bacterium]
MTAAGAALGLLPKAKATGDGKRRLPVLPVAALLREQQTLTAVERFSKLHDSPEAPLHEKYYRDLIPIERPKAGQQYAFEVDLDLCTGCKACVAGCHAQNGLDEDETWRTVGLLHGGTSVEPALQTVTTSCHHCLEPACMSGCPTKAYEKDPVTGIVKHLDDQCFGCQYCTLMCPYDAPKYEKKRGIVRKCDMCSTRLANGEAPACVEACPNGAIAIRVVERAEVVESSDARQFLPGAPDPEQTLPTTRYKTDRVMPANMLPADFYVTRPEHSHPPLVVMLTLTQLSVGAFALSLVADRVTGENLGNPLAQTVFACALALLALFASVFHLGRPLLAWRAVLGLRTSWLSREALVFGLFVQLAIAYAAVVAAPLLPLAHLPFAWLVVAAAPKLRIAAAVTGVVGVFCSMMVYVATKREQWSPAQTGIKFFGTMLAVGGAAVLAVTSFTSGSQALSTRGAEALLVALAATTFVKLSLDGKTLLHASDVRQSALKRVAVVMLGDLRGVTLTRFLSAALGGLLLPALPLAGVRPEDPRILCTVMFVALLVGEFAERYLFFRAAPASRMPGGLR